MYVMLWERLIRRTKYILLFYFLSRVYVFFYFINALSTNPKKWSNTLKQFFSCCQRIVFSVFDLFVGMMLKSLRKMHFQKNLDYFQ